MTVDQALALARKGEFARAAELLERGAGRSPQALYYAGWMRARAGQWREAAAHWSAIPRDSEWGRKAAAAAVPLLEETALRAYRAGSYGESLEAAERAGAFGARAEVSALSGLSLLKLGRRHEGRAMLAASVERLPAGELRREVERVLAQTAPSAVNEIQISAGAGFNSNLYGDGSSEDAEQAAFSDLDASIRRNWSDRFYGVLQGRWQEFLSLPESRYLQMSGGAGLRYFRAGYTLDVELAALYQHLGGSADAVSPRARIEVERRLGARAVRVEYQISRPLVAIDEFRTLNSEQHELSIGIEPVNGSWKPGFALLLGREGGGDIEEGTLQLPVEHFALGARVGVQGMLAPKTSLSVVTGIEHRIYDQKAFPGIEDRRDWTFSAAGVARHSAGLGLALFASAKAELNRSTLGADDVDDKNSFGTVISGGLEWSR